MKQVKAGLAILLLMCVAATCNKNPQHIAYTSLFSVEQTTTAAYDSYITGVIKGEVATNDVPKVSRAYNTFQIAMQPAISGAQFNWTNPAPQNVIGLANEVITAILEARKVQP